MATNTVPTPPEHRKPHQEQGRLPRRIIRHLTNHLGEHGADAALAGAGIITLAIGYAAPAPVAGLAIVAAALTGLTLVLRNTGGRE